MRLDPNPLFRRIIMPWYDSTPLCWILLLCMIGLVLFSITGIVVALGDPSYQHYQLVPWTLLLLSVIVGLSVSIRLMHRYHQQHKDEAEP